MGLTRLTASPLMAMGKLMKLEYFCTICWISVFSTNLRCDYLTCSTILVPLVSPSSSTYSISYVPLPSDVHLCATPPASLEVTSTRSLTMKDEQKPTPNCPMMLSLASLLPGSLLPSSPCTNSLEPERAIVPRRSMSACLLMPMPLSWMMSCPLAGKSSTLMVSQWLDCSLNLCFSRASDALESSQRTNTYASVYSDFATMSRRRLVSALNQRRSLLEEKGERGVNRREEHAVERAGGRERRAERRREASRRRFAFNMWGLQPKLKLNAFPESYGGTLYIFMDIWGSGERWIVWVNSKRRQLNGSVYIRVCSLLIWSMGLQVGGGDIIIMRRRTQKQQRQREQPPQQPAWELLPSATIQNYLHLHLSPYSSTISNKKTPHSPPKHPAHSQQAPSIQINQQSPNSITFHHRHKMTPFSFQFAHIFDSKAKPQQAAGVIDLSRTLLEEGKDFCFIAMGGQEANLSQFCGGGEGVGDSAGLLFQMLSQLWDRLQSMKTEASSSSPGVNTIRLSLKMLAIQQQKLYDMLSPKSQVTLKDSPTRTIITSTSLPVMSVYDLHVKLQEIGRQRRLLYPESAAVFEAEVTISYEGYMITQEEVTTRLFTFIEWPRGGKEDPSKGTSSHNNQALLTLNMCIYELYKLSLRPPERVARSQAKQLWAHFRNSPITMLTKHYFMGNSRVALLACLPLRSLKDNQNYQLLMLGKNLGKIDLKKFEECVLPVTHAPTPPLGVQYKTHKKMMTEPVEVGKTRGSSPEFSPAPAPPNMRKLKENLQRILREKESAEQRQNEEEMALLFKERKDCRLQLENIRYKREEIRIREDYGKMSREDYGKFSREDYGKLSQNQSRVIHPTTDLPTLPLLPNRRLSKPSTEELSRLAKEEEQALRRIDALQSKIVGSISKGGHGVSALKMEVRLQERELVESIANKSRILAILKGQLREIKIYEQLGRRQPKRKRSYIKSRSDHVPPITHNIIQSQQEPNYQQQRTPVNPQKIHLEEDIPSAKRDSQTRNGSFRLQTLKKLNKNNYMFEKRRLALKAKLSKGRQEVNEFYQNAAKKFQDYRGAK